MKGQRLAGLLQAVRRIISSIFVEAQLAAVGILLAGAAIYDAAACGEPAVPSRYDM